MQFVTSVQFDICAVCDVSQSSKEDCTVRELNSVHKNSNSSILLLLLTKYWLKWNLIKLLQGHFTQLVAETLWEYRADS